MKPNIDTTRLSSYKYVYEMYIDKTGQVVYERFPIAYINKTYVYIIRGGDQLVTLSTGAIWSSFADCFENKFTEFVYRDMKNGYRFHAFAPIGSDEFGAIVKNEFSARSKYDTILARKNYLNNSIAYTKSTIRRETEKLKELESSIVEYEEELKAVDEELKAAKSEVDKYDIINKEEDK